MDDLPEHWGSDATRQIEDVMDDLVADMPSGIERRLVLRLLIYWREICVERRFPSFGDVDPCEIPSIWPSAFVLDVAGHRDDPLFRIAGPKYAPFAARPLMGAPVSRAPANSVIEKSVAFFREVLDKEVPITRGGELFRPNGAKVLYRSILLPMSDDGKAVSGLLGAANCREVAGGK